MAGVLICRAAYFKPTRKIYFLVELPGKIVEMPFEIQLGIDRQYSRIIYTRESILHLSG